MNTLSSTRSKTNNPKNILGGVLGLFEEDDFERETTAISSITQAAGGISEAVSSLVQEIVQVEPEKKSDETGEFPLTGSIEFQKQTAETNRKRDFFQSLKEDQERVQRENDRVFEEEINDIITNLPTEQKNKLLHYQASYKDKSIYQRAELRKKLIEERRNAEKQEKQASVPSPAKQPSAMEGAFEGRSGNQGSGTANLSAQAVG